MGTIAWTPNSEIVDVRWKPPFFASLRLVSALGVLALHHFLSPDTYHAAFIAILFGHYVMAALASRSQAMTLAKGSSGLYFLFPLFLLGLFAYSPGIPDIGLYFGLHHVMSETFAPSSLRPPTAGSSLGVLTVSRGIMCAVIYAKLLAQ